MTPDDKFNEPGESGIDDLLTLTKQFFTDEELQGAPLLAIDNEFCPTNAPDSSFRFRLAEAAENQDAPSSETPVYLIQMFTTCPKGHEHGMAILAPEFFVALAEFLAKHSRFTRELGHTLKEAVSLANFMVELLNNNLLIEPPPHD